jgi:hypothetical protein
MGLITKNKDTSPSTKKNQGVLFNRVKNQVRFGGRGGGGGRGDGLIFIGFLFTSGYPVHNAPVELPPPPGPSHCPLRFFNPLIPPPSPVIYGTGQKRLSSSVVAAVFLHSKVQ